MDCDQVDRYLEAYLDARLTATERQNLRQHVRDCQACALKLDGLHAFQRRIEKTLATVDETQWGHLAAPRPAKKRRMVDLPVTPGPAPPANTAPPPLSANRRPLTRSGFWAVTAVILTVVTIWSFRDFADGPAAVAPSAGLDSILEAERVRLLAGGTLDLATDDLGVLQAWFAERAVAGLPPIRLPAGMSVEGGFLTYYAGAPVAGLVLWANDQPMSLHVRQSPFAQIVGMDHAAGPDLQAVTAVHSGFQLTAVEPRADASNTFVPTAVAPAAVDRLRGLLQAILVEPVPAEQSAGTGTEAELVEPR